LIPRDDDSEARLSARVDAGDEQALAALFSRHRQRLLRMVQVRLDPRLIGRVDPDDVLQEAWLAAVSRLHHFRSRGGASAFLWLRLIVAQTLVDFHRRHLGTAFRSALREVPLPGGPFCSSDTLARLHASQTSPSQAVIRAETADRLVESIEQLDPIDREVLFLRHFEELGNDEVAALLGLSRTAASNRYVRAVARLRDAWTLREDDARGR
jgi:RNA polymerase sigma-70 factor (ECF subfamily)